MVGRAPQEIDAIIRKSGDWRGETLSRVRGLVLGAGPAVVEEVKWKKPSRPEGVPVWSLDGIVCTGEMLKSAVRLTFPKGAQMKDPKKLFNARLESNSVRAIDLHEGERVPDAALKALIVEAVGLNVRSLRAVGEANGEERVASKVKKGTAYPAARRREGGTASPLDGYAGPAGSQQVPGGVVHELPR